MRLRTLHSTQIPQQGEFFLIHALVMSYARVKSKLSSSTVGRSCRIGWKFQLEQRALSVSRVLAATWHDFRFRQSTSGTATTAASRQLSSLPTHSWREHVSASDAYVFLFARPLRFVVFPFTPTILFLSLKWSVLERLLSGFLMQVTM